MPRTALVTARAFLDLDVDLAPLVDAVQAQAIEVETPAWDDPSVDWGAYDLAVLRSTWDYVSRYDEFLRWLDAAAARVELLNPPPVIRWSTDKRYLGALAERGVPVVPTEYLEPGDDVERVVGRSGELVVKPTISAGSKDTARHSDPGAAARHARELLAAGREVMVQPYLDAIDTEGETGLVYFGGELSHAFRKAPILVRDAPPTDEVFAPEEIAAREPTADEQRVAAAALAAVDHDLLYARVDLVRDADGGPRVLELELAEPSFFLAYAPGSAARFAAAVARRLGS